MECFIVSLSDLKSTIAQQKHAPLTTFITCPDQKLPKNTLVNLVIITDTLSMS